MSAELDTSERYFETSTDNLVYLDGLASEAPVESDADGRTVKRSTLEFQTLAVLCAEVDAAGPRRWLIRGIWPAGAYGVHGAEMKAQKTWNGLDLAVSVASGTPWFGAIPVDTQGGVLIFAGEGGKASIVRRLRSICASRSITAEKLPIIVCARAPHLSDDAHLEAFAEQLEQTKPSLVVLDPLYLAARGAKMADLYAMGELLERAQHLCEEMGAALFTVTHYNRKEGSGPLRITGAGPAEWGRVLIGARVISRHTHPETMATTVVSELDILGGEIPDQTIRIKRDISADDPADIDSPLRYHVELMPAEAGATEGDGLAPADRKILEAVNSISGPTSNSEIVDRIVEKHGHGLKRATVSKSLNKLYGLGLIDCVNPEAEGQTKYWQRLSEGVPPVPAHVPHTTQEEGVPRVPPPIGGTRHGTPNDRTAHPDDDFPF